MIQFITEEKFNAFREEMAGAAFGITRVQRSLKIGYLQAARLIEQWVKEGIAIRNPAVEYMAVFVPKQLIELRGKIADSGTQLGATNDFPDGKINPDDEGGLQIAIAGKDGQVFIEFGSPVAWLAFPPEQAKEFANKIIEHANRMGN